MDCKHELAFQLLQQLQHVPIYLKILQRKYRKYILDLIWKIHHALKQGNLFLVGFDLKIVELVQQFLHKLHLLIHLLHLHLSLARLMDQLKLLNELLDLTHYLKHSQLMDVNGFPKHLL